MKSQRVLLLEVPKAPNELWAMDFVQDTLSSGRRFRVLTIKDLFTHEALATFTDFSTRLMALWMKTSKSVLGKF